MGKKDDKQRTLENTVKAIEKQFGSGAIMQLEIGPTPSLRLSHGTLGIDVVLGIGVASGTDCRGLWARIQR